MRGGVLFHVLLQYTKIGGGVKCFLLFFVKNNEACWLLGSGGLVFGAWCLVLGAGTGPWHSVFIAMIIPINASFLSPAGMPMKKATELGRRRGSASQAVDSRGGASISAAVSDRGFSAFPAGPGNNKCKKYVITFHNASPIT